MPFEIEKGYGASEIKKSVPHPVVREGDMVYISPPSDLAELLNFKVYHITNKKKGSGKSQRRLVGEHYLRGNEVLGVVKKAKAKDVLDARSSELQTYGHAKISNLLRKIRKLKVKKYSKQEHQKEIFDRLQQSSAGSRAVSAGQPILHGLEERTLKETIDWAFEYVNSHADELSQILFSVVDELRTYATWKEKNRLLKAGIVDNSQNVPKRKVGILHTDAGGNQSETAHLPFRRPKNISLLDQLNRIDMIGFNRFIELIGNKPSDNSPPRPRQTGVWTASASASTPNNPQSPRSPRRQSVSSPRRPSLTVPNSPQKGHVNGNFGHALDDISETKPSSSIAGAYGSSTAPSSHHPHSSHNHPPSQPTQPMAASKNDRRVQSANNSQKKNANDPLSSSLPLNSKRPPETSKPTHHKIQSAPRPFDPKPPSAPSSSSFPSGRNNRRKSVLVPSHGMETPILTDDDTALLVKVDRRDSGHQINPFNNQQHQRWGSQTNTTDTTPRVEEEGGGEEAGELDDHLSDFGSLNYQGGKTVTYSNTVDVLTSNWDSLQLYRFNNEFNANEIQDSKIRAFYQRGHLREEYLNSQQNHTFTTITKAEITSEHLVNVWEEFSKVDSVEYQKIKTIMNQKDFNRTTFIKTLHDCFVMEGTDRKLGRLGSTLMVDLMSMKRRARHKIYCQKMAFLSKEIWFTTILIKLKEYSKKSFQRIPHSLFKFLGILHILLMYGWSVTLDLFWMLIERTIEAGDHKEIIVHRTIKAIREYLKVSPESFMRYLEENNLQPCTELLAQIREIKQQKTRAVRSQQLKQGIGHFSPRLKATLHRFDVEGTAAGRNKSHPPPHTHQHHHQHQINQENSDNETSHDLSSLPTQHLTVIREQSESVNYGIEYNSLTPMRREGMGVGHGRKVAFEGNKITEEEEDMSYGYGYGEGEGEEEEGEDQLSPLGSMSFGSELPETVEIRIPKRIK